MLNFCNVNYLSEGFYPMCLACEAGYVVEGTYGCTAAFQTESIVYCSTTGASL